MHSDASFEQALRSTYQDNRAWYIDACGENNYTLLAEVASEEFSLYETDGFSIPERVFELSRVVLDRENPDGAI